MRLNLKTSLRISANVIVLGLSRWMNNLKKSHCQSTEVLFSLLTFMKILYKAVISLLKDFHLPIGIFMNRNWKDLDWGNYLVLTCFAQLYCLAEKSSELQEIWNPNWNFSWSGQWNRVFFKCSDQPSHRKVIYSSSVLSIFCYLSTNYHLPSFMLDSHEHFSKSKLLGIDFYSHLKWGKPH